MSEGTPLRRVRVVVRGRVQGVAFRAHSAEAARRAGVAGWVRNRPDGSVEAALEGEPEAVDRALAALEKGPRFARVEGLEVSEETPVGALGFEIRP